MRTRLTSRGPRLEQFATLRMSMTATADAHPPCGCNDAAASCSCAPTVAAMGPNGEVPVPEPADTPAGEPGEPVDAEPGQVEVDPHPFVAWLAPLDVWSSDGRRLEEAGASWRDPLTNTPALMCQTVTAGGHDGAAFAGTFTRFWVEDGWLMGAGLFDPEGWDAYDAERLAREGLLQGVSVDLAVWDAEWSYDEAQDTAFMSASRWECLGATIVPFPAFADAHIECVAVDDPRLVGEPATDAPPVEPAAVVAAGTPDDLRPPAGLFARREFAALTPLTWTRDESGWWSVAGHIAGWGVCHTGRQDLCVTAPRSQSGYAYFATGELELDDGSAVPVGTLTMGCGHAGLELTPAATAAHYDNSGATVAWLTAWEDEHGIAVAGCAPFDIADETVQLARTVVPSGDWRPIRGSLELMAVLLVGTPGFPVTRAQAAIVDGRQSALVAAGLVDGTGPVDVWPPPAIRSALVAAAHREAGLRAAAAVA